MTITEWAEVFFEEKDLPYKSWEIEGPGGTHFIDNEVVIEHITSGAFGPHMKKIRDTLVMIDFKNGDVNHFLEHLARGIVATYDGVMA